MTETNPTYIVNRAAYIARVSTFLNDTDDTIIGRLVGAQQGSVIVAQRNAWYKQIEVLKTCLTDLTDAVICFEYLIPRMGKRIDNVVVTKNAIYAIEFKVGSTSYDQHAKTQSIDYALDLKNFHQQSRFLPVIPVLVATDAPGILSLLTFAGDQVANLVLANKQNLSKVLTADVGVENNIDSTAWVNSVYEPTPTIIEASQALYGGHDVTEISRSESGIDNLSITTEAISEVIERCKKSQTKAICFVTGVPGAGKTLAGLNLACTRRQANSQDPEHAVFLSGNGPLVSILQEALARDAVVRAKHKGTRLTRSEALSQTKSFIQNIHHFRDEYLDQSLQPIERVAVFDEAQRAWSKDQTSKFMKQKRGIENFEMSEPEYLIEVMGRAEGWRVIVCLIGHGQEINTGEAGIVEWFHALSDKFLDWGIFIPNSIEARSLISMPGLEELKSRATQLNGLHLSACIRSFRSEYVSDFVGILLDGNAEKTQVKLEVIRDDFPIVITRSVETAKQWIKDQARGSERYGLLASSGARRLKAIGITAGSVKGEERNWFLNNAHDVRSSYYLEDAASEFETQGLEMDWSMVVWGGDLIHDKNSSWTYKKFRGNKWQNINSLENQNYRLNAYRVLLTRARQGMVIVIPTGDIGDSTRPCSIYDPTWNYLCDCKLKQI